jgi:glycine/sarcosine N-methyltransferase
VSCTQRFSVAACKKPPALVKPSLIADNGTPIMEARSAKRQNDMDPKDCYNDLASHYHLLFENWDSSIARQASILGPILERQCGLPRETRILDIACGIGTQSLGLAKLGFRITGCDISPAAVARARVEASQRNLDIQFSVADMLDLTALEQSNFDAVICMDNALPHLENAEQVIQAATQMRNKLRPKGLFMASIRD